MGGLWGIDGCPAGWLAVAQDGSGSWSFRLVERFEALLEAAPEVCVVDMPIGLVDAGHRSCDQAARRYLGFPRRASVFTPPIRPALAARSWEHACRIRQSIEGKRLARQSYQIAPRIRELDGPLRARPRLQLTVFEGHPEVSFAAMNEGQAMRHPKRHRAGRKERLRLIGDFLGAEAVALFESVCGAFARTDVGRDDVLDAIALSWTAGRIATGDAGRLPRSPGWDAEGLRMQIHY